MYKMNVKELRAKLEELKKLTEEVELLIAKKVRRVYMLEDGYVTDDKEIYDFLIAKNSGMLAPDQWQPIYKEICVVIRKDLGVNNVMALTPITEKNKELYNSEEVSECTYPIQISLFDIDTESTKDKDISLTGIEEYIDEETGERKYKTYIEVEI